MQAARRRHLVQAENAAGLAKLRAGEEAELRVGGRRYRVRPPGEFYYPAALAVAQLRPGHWVVGWVVDKDGLHLCQPLHPEPYVPTHPPRVRRAKRLSWDDVLADIIEEIGAT